MDTSLKPAKHNGTLKSQKEKAFKNARELENYAETSAHNNKCRRQRAASLGHLADGDQQFGRNTFTSLRLTKWVVLAIVAAKLIAIMNSALPTNGLDSHLGLNIHIDAWISSKTRHPTLLNASRHSNKPLYGGSNNFINPVDGHKE